MSAPSIPPPKRGYAGRPAEDRRAERRKSLLAAGLDLIGRRGYTGTPVEALCIAAGISSRNFYQEFRNRTELLAELYRDISTRAAEAMSTAWTAAEGENLANRAASVVDAYITTTTNDPRWARIAFIEGPARIGARPGQHWEEALLAIIQHATRRADEVDRDYRLAAIAITGAMTALVRHWVASGRQDSARTAVTGELTRLILGMLAPAQAAALRSITT